MAASELSGYTRYWIIKAHMIDNGVHWWSYYHGRNTYTLARVWARRYPTKRAAGAAMARLKPPTEGVQATYSVDQLVITASGIT